MNKVRPNLWNVVENKKVGSLFNYSKAVLEKGGNWGYKELFAFLKNPKAYIKGICMAFAGISNQSSMDYCKLFDENNDHVAYRKLQGKKASVVFFGGFASNMKGTKATAIYKFCQENDIALVVFDYFGHGCSSGNFTDYTINDWQKNCAKVISELTSDKQIIIGSSMGGWLMLLTALQFPEKITALIGISSAPDFTEDLIFKQLSGKQKEELDSKGIIDVISGDCAYKITKNFIEEGRKNLLLNRETININCPVRLLHSINDKNVPYQTSLNLAKKIKSTNVEVHLLKSAEHNMSDNHSLEVLFKTIREFLPAKT